jgi:hypothetical protein
MLNDNNEAENRATDLLIHLFNPNNGLITEDTIIVLSETGEHPSKPSIK